MDNVFPSSAEEGWLRDQGNAAKPPLNARTGCVIRMNETLSRKENGAVHVGNTDLILPVRVRTCAENVGRTGVRRDLGSSGTQPVRASNGRNGEASQRYFAGRRVGRSDVRASTLWAKHEIEPRFGLRREGIRFTALRLLWCVALSCGDNGDSFRPDEVPRRLCPEVEQSKRDL